MKRKLLKQIATEWRSNVWLAVELLVISVIVFYILDVVMTYNRFGRMSVGVDITNVWEIEYGWRGTESPDYVAPVPVGEETAEEAASRQVKDELKQSLRRLREMPGVVAAAHGSNAPYNYNFNGRQYVRQDQKNDTAASFFYVNSYLVQPDYVKVFNIHGVNGETPEQLAKILQDRRVLLTSNVAGETPTDMINRQIVRYHDEDDAPLTVGAIIDPVRRSDYEPAYAGTLIETSTDFYSRSVYVKVSDEVGREFFEELRKPQSPVNVGNTYIISARPFTDIRRELHRNDDATLRNLTICMGFLLLVVFLGLLGTFWFRTQQRVREIAIRKVSGATPLQIFRRLMGEGLLILLIVTPLALVVDALIINEGLTIPSFMQVTDSIWENSAVEALIVAGLLALMIVAGIFFPARKAMAIEPAEVLRGE